MTEAQFVAGNAERWKEFANLLSRSGRRRFADEEAVSRFPAAYRLVCRDLNLARARRYSWSLVDDLNRLVWEGHQILYRHRSDDARDWIALMIRGFPATVRRYWGLFLLCHLLFYGLGLAAFFFVQSADGRADALLGSATIEKMKEMYDPEAEHFLRPREVETDADMFGFYIYNNITIGLRTFAGGVLAGLGSLVILGFNAVVIGATAGVLVDAGFSETFFSFVAGHGSFELTAILLFAMAGFLLGGAMVNPGRWSRAEALRRRGLEVLPLVAGAVVFLFLAAGIEAFWSSSLVPAVVKFSVAGVLWVFVYGFLLWGGSRDRT